MKPLPSEEGTAWKGLKTFTCQGPKLAFPVLRVPSLLDSGRGEDIEDSRDVSEDRGDVNRWRQKVRETGLKIWRRTRQVKGGNFMFTSILESS